MGVDSSISSKVLLRLVIGILTILSLEDWVASGSLNDDYKAGECGDVMKGCSIWSDTEPCPNPSFENECHDKPLLNLRPFGEDAVSYENNSKRLSSELERSGNACFARIILPSEFDPPASSIEPPSSLGFNWKPSHLAFLHDCSSFPNYLNPHSTCPSDGPNRSYVALIIGREEDLHLDLSVCKSPVIVPVKLASPDSEEIGNDDNEKLKHGFRLQWNLTSWKSCVDCQKSGGKCRGSDGHFQCLDSGKDYPPPYKRAASGVGIAIVILVVYSLRKKPLIRKHMAMMMGKREHSVAAQQIEGLISSRRYTYKDIKRMTNSFQEKLGQGGYGYVYKGKLQDGQLVAVKLLKNLKGDGEEFINEVASISRTSHVNIVNLLGFCSEGSKRALVYEFMPNGSLEKFIFKSDTSESNRQLNWETLILHFDIKPHNILLDWNYCPKISDFGLAKICPREESIVSMLDVYSYGMMVLEMVGGRKIVEVGVDRTSEIYFPHWIHRRLKLQEELGLRGIANEEDEGVAKKMIIISLWCIQIDPRDQPPMTQVAEMLKGSVEALQIPPKPTLSSPSSRSPIATTDENLFLQFDVTTTSV
ncbi:hypothetical protein ACJRO7_028339 [Eucalyptus globulus]|uniref:Protein kinase domain-containing protein n=1 Tax=Eucalyptus globulus TaxID=34317 RepID=A0ABD3K730_EUCGL